MSDVDKRKDKGVSFVVGNNIAIQHGAFGSETTELVLCSAHAVVQGIAPAAKTIAAQQLMDYLARELVARRPAVI